MTASNELSHYPSFLSASEAMRPVIGISGAHSGTTSVMCMMQMIHWSGATPLLLCEHKTRTLGSLQLTMLQDLSRIHGLIVMGNDADIDPSKYGASVGVNTQIERNEVRASYEERMIEMAIKTRLPLLGICGGMQRINVICGGTLHQYLSDLVGDHRHMRRDVAPSVGHSPICFRRRTHLSIIASRVQRGAIVHENSLHRQAVDHVGDGLMVSAVSHDGKYEVVKAIEAATDSPYANQFLMEVQWHPEYGASEVGQAIMSSFVEHARGFVQQTA